MIRAMARVMLFAALAALAGCLASPVAIQPVPTAKPVELGAEQVGKFIQLKRLVVHIPEHEVIGVKQIGPFCRGVEQLFWKSLDKIYLSEDELTEKLREELGKYGYKVLGGQYRLFDEGPRPKADLVLGGMVRDLKGNICYNPPDSTTSCSGEVYLRVEWQVYDPRQKKVLLKVETAGSYKRDLMELVPDRGRSLWLGAYRAAVANLAANPALQKLVSGKPALSPPPRPKPTVQKPVQLTPLKLTYAAAQSFKMPGDADAVRAAMVGVYGDSGSGDGFFISPGGYLLTSAQSVTGSKYVKVRLADGNELLGEVLRSDAAWDVAIVRIKASVAAALPMASGRPRVGSSVFAVSRNAAAPKLRQGVVGDYITAAGRRLGTSTVNLPTAMNGAPLVDRHGAVVGIAAPAKGGNFFIPIVEVFPALNLN